MARNMAYWPASGNNRGSPRRPRAQMAEHWQNRGEAWVNGKRQIKKRPAVTPARAAQRKERQERLAEALRENLRKRKSRQRKQMPAHGGGDKD